MIICIIGIDGAGKTTLAHNLVEALQSQGHEAVYLYGRTIPIISRFLMFLGRVSILHRYDPWEDYPRYNAYKKQTMSNRLLRFVYTIAIFMDYLSQIWIKLLLHFGRNRTVVLDRYIYDTVISDLAVHLNYTNAQTKKTIDRGLQVLPKPKFSFLVDLPEEVAFSRKDDMPHIEYLIERRGWYLDLESRAEMIKINGEHSQELLQQEVLSIINV